MRLGRFWFYPFWGLTNWGFMFNSARFWAPALRLQHGGDEWHNPSRFFIVPLIGEFGVFERGYSTDGPEHIYAYNPLDGWSGHFDPDCSTCIEIKEMP